MTLEAIRLRSLALVLTLVLPLIGSGRAWGQNIIAQWAFGGDTGETSTGKDLSGRSGMGWEATTVDPNATASNARLSDSIPPSNEDYIEFTSPSYTDDAGNTIPVLRFEPGNNSNNAAEAIQKDKYFQITVTANAGSVLNLSSLTFNAGRGGDATPRGWAVLSSVDGYTNIVDTQDVPTTRPVFTPFTIDLSGASYQGLTTVGFRIFTYLPGGGRSIEYSNVTINGTVQ